MPRPDDFCCSKSLFPQYSELAPSQVISTYGVATRLADIMVTENPLDERESPWLMTVGIRVRAAVTRTSAMENANPSRANPAPTALYQTACGSSDYGFFIPLDLKNDSGHVWIVDWFGQASRLMICERS